LRRRATGMARELTPDFRGGFNETVIGFPS
jgi:hypothetical protein